MASVEMGNTTTKCILTGVSLETGKSYVINKTVSMSRDIRPPKSGEEIFGETLDGTKLSRQAVTELACGYLTPVPQRSAPRRTNRP